MMETFMVLIIIVFLIFFGLFMYFKYSVSHAKQTAVEVCVQDASQMLSSVLSLPELQCSVQGVVKSNCIDTVKLLMFEKSSKFLEGSAGCLKKIEFVQVYPKPDKNDTECNVNNMKSPDFPLSCGKWTLTNPKNVKNKSTRIISQPISLYYPHINQYGIGLMRITLYMKQ